MRKYLIRSACLWILGLTLFDTSAQTPCIVTCPSNITVQATSSSGAIVNYSAPTSSGDCGTLTSLPASGSTFPVGITTVNTYENYSQKVYALVSLNNLISFDIATPSLVSPAKSITGLVQPFYVDGENFFFENIVAIDFRPANGKLYGLGVLEFTGTAKLYTIDVITGVAIPVGATTFNVGSSGIYSIDFNPVTDELRLVTGSLLNFRIDPDLGTVIAADPAINPFLSISGIAYTNSVASATSTTLYDLSPASNSLYYQGGIDQSDAVNNGALTLVGAVGVDFITACFDITQAGTGIASLFTTLGSAPFYKIELATGTSTFINNITIGPGIFVQDIAAAPLTVSPSCSFTVTVTPPSQTVSLTCPVNTTTSACLTQALVNSAFSSWLATASASGGCNGVLTNNNTGAPPACGGSTEVTFTYTSSCAPFTTTCRATFTVPLPPTVSLTCPVNTTTAACLTQSQVNSAFSSWLASASASGGCNGVLTNNNTGAPPACGGSTDVRFTYTSSCAPLTTTCLATFTVAPPPTVSLTCPVNTTTSNCLTQAQVNTAFSAWLATASASGGCNGVVTNNNTGAPSACVGGSTTVRFTYTTSCAPFTTTCEATFTVPAASPVVLTCPVNTTTEACQSQAAINVAFASWLATASASGGCTASLTNNNTGAPPACGGSTTVTFTFNSGCPQFTTSCQATFTVPLDETPPTIAGEYADPSSLWPPNHQMKNVYIGYTATNCDASTATTSLSVTSNEPIDGTGDGDTSPDWEIIDNHNVKLRAERAGNGNGRIYTITITATDACGNTSSKVVTVIVAHNITAPVSGKPFKVGSTVGFSGTFWDKPGNKHTGKWLIDGRALANATITEPVGNQNGKSTGSYKFSSPGVYKLQMNITDQNGITSYANTNGDLEAIVVIYDPNGGHTYGGGYYDSPAGALSTNPSVTGKASYGFAMNYFKNSTYPKGETQFEFKVGDFEFNALNFEYLVISNSMAQFKGTGKIIGGQSGIGFTMTVVDGQLDGTGIDKIRMKIYNKNNGTVIYDNQFGESDAALPAQAVGSNSTVVISGVNPGLTQSNNTMQKAEMEATAPEVSNELDVSVYPNPATSHFNIAIKSNDTKERIVVKIFDQYGRSIETRTNVAVGSAVRLGDLYRPGVYYIRVIQGKQHKVIKLIKLSD